jgi:hypothetical protein
LNNYTSLKYSTNEGAPQVTTPSYGLVLDNNGTGYYTADCTFTNLTTEGFVGIGIDLVDAQGNVFLGGTSEAVSVGIRDTEDCFRNSFYSLWCEANTARDLELYGKSGSFNNSYFGSNGVSGSNIELVTSQSTSFNGGFIRHANIQSTSSGTHFSNVGLSDNAALGFTGSGNYSRQNCKRIDVNGNVSGYFADICPVTQSIRFDPVQVAVSDENTLDDYQEGVFTPVLTAATGTITPNALLTSGDYTKVGNLVTCTGTIYVTSVSSPSGQLTITGLPFVSKAGSNRARAGAVSATDLNATAAQPIMLSLPPNSATLVVAKLVSGVKTDMASDVKANTEISFSITYQCHEP